MNTEKQGCSRWVRVGAVLAVFGLVISWLATPFGSGCPTDTVGTTEPAQVFLMGTVGGSYEDPNRDCWREDVVQPILDELGVSYFNPVISDFTDEDAEREARAIANAETIILVITSTSPSVSSLAESGWAVVSALERDQTVIAYIEPESENDDSQRARTIVLAQSSTLVDSLEQVVFVDDLDELVEAIYQRYRD